MRFRKWPAVRVCEGQWVTHSTDYSAWVCERCGTIICTEQEYFRPDAPMQEMIRSRLDAHFGLTKGPRRRRRRVMPSWKMYYEGEK